MTGDELLDGAAEVGQLLSGVAATILLLVTWLANRRANRAMESNKQLTADIQVLVKLVGYLIAELERHRRVATYPLITVSETTGTQGRLVLANDGNGPLAQLSVTIGGIRRDARDLASPEINVAAIGAGSRVSVLAGYCSQDDLLEISGVSLAGRTYLAAIHMGDIGDSPVGLEERDVAGDGSLDLR
jgi:hypothetical protein